jgi:hypothetical protein
LALGLVLAPAVAQTLPTFDRFPADARGRLARAVEQRVHPVTQTLGGAELSAIASGQVDRPDVRRSLWNSIEGALGATQASPDAATPSAPTTLIGALDDAIAAYMTELGRIALEMDRHGERDAVTRLAPLHPGEQGSGSIDVGTLGAFRQLEVTFRGAIAHPDGTSPAVAAIFYLLPDGGGPPIPGRLLIPTSGAEPSFRAEIANDSGQRETRDYGWRPRLARMGAILELRVNGQWARVEDENDMMPRQRTPRDPVGFCDATCGGAP